MSNARKLLLLAIMVIVAMVVFAPAAFGQIQEEHETLVALDENGDHCTAINMTNHTGGCVIHAKSEGNVELRKHVFGIESHITNCDNEFWGHLNEDAEGWIYHQKLTGAGCARKACHDNGAPEPREWPAHGDEAHTDDPLHEEGETNVNPLHGETEVLTTVFCVEPLASGAEESCEVDVPFNQVGETTTYEFGTNEEQAGHGIGGFRCELVGHWLTEHGVGDQEHVENKANLPEEEEITIDHIPAENTPEAP